MDIIKYIILGIIQGLTEPLPISSSGHLVLFKNLFNANMLNDVNFEIVVNFGSFLAILFIFRKDVLRLIQGFFGYIFDKKNRKKFAQDFKYCLLIIIGSIPVGIAGLLFKDKIDSWSGNMTLLGCAFLITSLMLFLVRKANGKKKDYDITVKDAIIIGLLQMVALTPGISRSGTVLVGCLLCGISRESSLRYTFMLYFPVSVASMGLGVVDLFQDGNLSNLLLPYTLGMIAACIVTYFSYRWLSSLVKRGKLWKFSVYCFILAIFVLIYFR
ncbi:TPA: undecaprenyl-diphosphate phosphatase [Candidatus Ventrenecus avicola]|nr:undecaprenyl-diphosphate phosphatase [Candidatus Ventrenecus avicola]